MEWDTGPPHAGLCSRSTRIQQVTNFCLWVTEKTYFFHTFMCGHPEFHGLEPSGDLLVIFSDKSLGKELSPSLNVLVPIYTTGSKKFKF